MTEKQREYAKKFIEVNPKYFKDYYQQNKNKWIENRKKYNGNFLYRLVDKYGKIIRLGLTKNVRSRLNNYFNYIVWDEIGFDELVEKYGFVRVDVMDLHRNTREELYSTEYNYLRCMNYKPALNVRKGKSSDWNWTYIDIGHVEKIWECYWDLEKGFKHVLRNDN